MARDFHILSLLKEGRTYLARVRFLGLEEDYTIKTNAFLFHTGLDSEYNFMICDYEHRIPENGNSNYISIKVSGKSSERARKLEGALIEFMDNQ